ncbi:MAG: hypothetical protein K0Q79_1612 [Flavipsychrobacter sp.]|jgi:hypothetical protein|nr:hypothetical protein [Flavipsychrobacter sp.]
MKKKITYLITLLLCSFGVSATTYYNIANSTSLQSTTQWGVNTDGSGAHPANFTTSGDVFNIYNGTTTSLSNNWTLASGVTINIGDGTSAITFEQNNENITTTCTINVRANATFLIEDVTVGQLGTLAATSTVNYGSSDAHIIQAVSYGNLIYSSTSTSGFFESGTATVNVSGDFTISDGRITVNNTASTTVTVNVSGDFTISGDARIILASNSTASSTINVTGTVSASSTSTPVINFCSVTSSTGGVSIFQANGNVTLNGTNTNIIEWGNGTISSNYFGVKGNLTITGSGRLNTASSTTPAIGFIFNGTGIQTLTNNSTGSTSSTECSYQVNSGAYVRLGANLVLGTGTTIHSDITVLSGGTLDCQGYNISGGSTGGGGCIVNSGARLITAHTGGINSSVTATGSTFSSGANYEFNGTSAQVTSTGLPSSIVSPGSLTIANNAGVTLSQSTSFSSGATLNMEDGTFTIGSSLSMSSGSNVVRDDGALSATPSTYSGVNLSYANLGINTSAITTANEFPASFTGNVTVNKTGATITLNNTKTLTGALTLTAGTLDASSSNYDISLTSNWTNNAGSAAFTARTATVTMNGSSSQTIGGSSGTSFNDLKINNSAGVTLSVATTFASGDTLSLQNGAFTVGSNLSMISGSNLIRDNGTLSATPATYNGVNLTYANLGNNASAVTTGNEWPSSFNGNVTISKTGATITLNNTKTATSSITLTAGTLDASASNYGVSLSGNWTNNSGGTAFTARSGTVTFNGSSAQSISGSATTSFNNFTNSNSSAAVAVNSNINVSGTLNMNGAATLLTPVSTVVINSSAAVGTISGSGTIQVTRTAATADYVNQYKFSTNTLTGMTVDYAGAGTQAINSTVGTYGGIKTSGSGTKTLTGAITAGSNGITIGSGTTLDVSSSNYQVTNGGNWTNSGTFTSQSGTVVFNATTTGKTLSGTMTGSNKFYNLTFNGTGGAWSFGSNSADIGNNFTITTGTVTAPSSTLQVAGNWSNSGTFTNNSGTVTMNATSTGKTLSGSMTGSNKFHNLTFNGSGGAWSFGSTAADVGNNFTITTGTVTAASSTLQVAGNWSNSGTFTHNSGLVTFNKTGAQTISGSSSTAFNSLTIGSASVTTLSTSGHTVRSILQCNDTLNANGNLTLLSSSAQTALIDGAGTGKVLGNVTMQRYLDSAYGYRYLSSPFEAATLSQLSSYINFSSTFPNFYRYNENVNYNGWVKDTLLTDTLQPCHGYAANYGASTSSVTISLNGTVNNGSLSRTLYNNNQAYTQGFNLVGNPYPSPINWTASSGWTKTNIDNAVYYFKHSDTNRYYGRYSSYISGVSSDGIASNIIPAMQGFFVHVSNGSYPVTGTLGFSNTVRTTNLTPYYFKPTADRPLVRLDAGFTNNSNNTDPAVVYFDDNATANFDSELDALKLMNTDAGVPSLYSQSSDEKTYSIQSLKTFTDSVTTVPLGLKTDHDGLVKFNVRNIENIAPGMHIWFYDAQTGIVQDLKTNPQYQVQLTSGKYEKRFYLQFTEGSFTNIPGVTGELNAFSSGGNLYVYLIDDKAGLTVTDVSGRVLVAQELEGQGYHEIKLHPGSGIYIVTLYSKSGKRSKKVFIGND